MPKKDTDTITILQKYFLKDQLTIQYEFDCISNTMDGKITLVTHRGTKITRIDAKPSAWAGKKYQDEQMKLMESMPLGTSVMMKRGTKSVQVSKYPKIKKMNPYEGYLICCARGTSSRHL